MTDMGASSNGKLDMSAETRRHDSHLPVLAGTGDRKPLKIKNQKSSFEQLEESIIRLTDEANNQIIDRSIKQTVD